MKTYSKRKLDDEDNVILDLDELCRLCMTREEEMIPIFDYDEAVPYTIKIMACVSLEVFEGDGLPSMMCPSCKFQLEKSYTFRKKCEQSDYKLREHLKDINFKVEVTSPKQSLINSNEQASDQHAESNSSNGKSLKEFDKKNENDDEDPPAERDMIQVAYIEPEPDIDDSPANITLPTEIIDKEACTLSQKKIIGNTVLEIAEEGNKKSHIDENYSMPVDNSNNDNGIVLSENSPNIDAIANAVKATLANQPGIDISGTLQLKIIPSEGRNTQVEVTTADGSVIVMELLADECYDVPTNIEENIEQKIKVEQDEQPEGYEYNEDGELKIFKCTQCVKSFARRIQLKRHMSVHMQQRGCSCGICEKWFPTRSALIRHERIHTGERPFQCELCTKSFAQKEILHRHLATHSGQKPFQCTHCGKGYAQREQLRIHLRTHMSETGQDITLHYCSLCPKVFCHASGLSRHLLTHTGKTFKCMHCDRCFTDKSSLKRHMKQVENQEYQL